MLARDGVVGCRGEAVEEAALFIVSIGEGSTACVGAEEVAARRAVVVAQSRAAAAEARGASLCAAIRSVLPFFRIRWWRGGGGANSSNSGNNSGLLFLLSLGESIFKALDSIAGAFQFALEGHSCGLCCSGAGLGGLEGNGHFGTRLVGPTALGLCTFYRVPQRLF